MSWRLLSSVRGHSKEKQHGGVEQISLAAGMYECVRYRTDAQLKSEQDSSNERHSYGA